MVTLGYLYIFILKNTSDILSVKKNRIQNCIAVPNTLRTQDLSTNIHQ